jgi:uncharacterized DUF497 family protein
MGGTIFEWDDAKDRANQKKHGLSFKDAAAVFFDPFRLTRQDRIENGEVRWQTVGALNAYCMILVAHVSWDDEDNEIIRIVSARPVTRHERRNYEEQDS